MFNKTTKYYLLSTISILAVVSFIGYSVLTKPKTGYILIKEVYDNFDLKKELEKKFLLTKNYRQKTLDSLELNLKFLANKIRQEQENNKENILLFNNQRDFYLERKRTIEEDNSALTNQYDKEILTQLNQYISDYGAARNYTYIFGTEGNGTVMYSTPKENITKEVIEYINKKYNGKSFK